MRQLKLVLYLAVPVGLLILTFSTLPSDLTRPLKKSLQQLQTAINPPQQLSWLTTQGNRIVDQNGNPVILRGVNIPSIDWQQGSWTGKAITYAAEKWHVNVIRTRITQTNFLRHPQKVFDQLETDILYPARRHNLYVILDPKFDNNRPLPDSGTLTMWRQIAQKYKDDPHILFDPLAEPHGVTHAQIFTAYRELIPVIREVNPRSLIFVTGAGWGRAVNPYLDNPLPFDNLVYRSNPYNRSGEFSGLFGQIAATYPVFLGEFGADGYPPMTQQSVADLLSYANDLNLGWTAWVFNASGCPCLLKNNTTFEPSSYGRIVLNFLLKTNPSPTPGQTLTQIITEQSQGIAIYDDSLQHAFNDLSWGITTNLQSQTQVFSGRYAIEATLTPQSGFNLYTWSPFVPTGAYLSFYLWIEPSQTISASLWLKDDHAADLPKVDLKTYLTPAKNGWLQAQIPLSSLNPQGKTITGLVISDFLEVPASPIYLDEIRFTQ